MSSELVPVPNLQAAAQLPPAEAARLREVGFRSLQEDHPLRNLARWNRRTWRPAVRVHALRALVRSQASLASLSARAQDMLFAVFRTVNASNREVAAKIFGVLLLAEDPWLIDSGGDGVDGDAERSAKAFLSLYDARHKFLGNSHTAAGAFVDPEMLHRENDALRRHLHQTAPVAKSRRLVANQGMKMPLPAPPSPPAGRSEPRTLSPMDRFMPFMYDASSGDERKVAGDTSSGHDRRLLEARITELSGEVQQLRQQLRESERRISTLSSSYDLLLRLVLENMPSDANIAPDMLVKLKTGGLAKSPPRADESKPTLRSAKRDGGEMEMSGAGAAKKGGSGLAAAGATDGLKRAPPLKPIDISAAKPPSGLHEHEHEIPNMLSPERTPRRSGGLRITFPLPVSATTTAGVAQPISAPTATQVSAPADASDKTKSTESYDLESFRSMVQASPWGKTEDGQPLTLSVGKDVPRAMRTPVRVFRDGRWLENQ